MCKDGDHHCSNCDATLDSGKQSEYKIIDYMYYKDKGTVENKRTILCLRCLADPMTAEFVKMVEGLAELPKYAPKHKREPGPNEVCCLKCGKLIKPFTPHVSLTIMWDVNYEKITVKDNVICKDCYSRDKRTRAVWTFLAKLGKNPTFAPTVTCASADKCGTFEAGNNMFSCKHISVKDTTVTEGRGKNKVSYVGHRLACGRHHPKTYRLLSKGDHIKKITPLAANQAAQTLGLDKMFKQVKTVFKNMDKNAKNCKDPIARMQMECQNKLLKLMMGPIGLKL